MLLRFRKKRIGIIADIEKAFLQVGLHQVDRDVIRFIWLKDIHENVTDNNTQIFRFARLPFGIISSPFLLSATVEHHLDETNTTTAKQIKDDIYVDNLITDTNNNEEALQLYKEAKKIFHDAPMDLRDWISNSEFVNENTIPVDLMKERVTWTKVLGLIWNTSTDKFSISTKKLENIEQAKTKQEVLATLASIFNPLRLTTPVTLKMKLLLQELREKEKEWDERLSSEEVTTWKGIMTDLNGISLIHLPRFLVNRSSQLQCFCDTSSKAYATAIYLRTIKNNKTTVNLVFSNARNAPKKKLTIPRLELISVLIGTRSLRFVTKAMRLENAEKILWRDFQCVLQWIKNRENTSVFVSHLDHQ